MIIEELSESGRALCFLIDTPSDHGVPPWVSAFADHQKSEMRVLKISYGALDYQNLEVLARDTIEALAERRVRQAAFVTFGTASLILWKIALLQQKLIRNAIVVNGESRPPISRRERFIDWLEHKLPLGLPFRGYNGQFNALPFLQRLRFPVFILSVDLTAQRLKNEAAILKQELPIAWSATLEDSPDLPEKLLECVRAFQVVPTKCPQKNRLRQTQSYQQV
ncbi:hypothetical protein EBR25_07210 [bacterium]|nr:hypothetical protein [bacterium]